jgi:1-acyl-sn-glycerol-3-phosphate acyltransferase
MLLYLRSALFRSVIVVATIIYSTLCLLVGPLLPFRQRYCLVTGINRFYLWWARLACGVHYEVEGMENLPKDRPYVILSNHQSDWETFFFQVFVGPLCTVLKKELLRIPFFGWALAMLRPIAIDRNLRSGAMKQILKQGRERLKEQIPVLIFPQGTRVKVGEIGSFNKGGAMLACSAKVPVVTIVHNAGDYWPSKSFLKYPGTIRVVVGPLIETQGRSVQEVHEETSEWLERKIKEVGC